MKLCKVVKARRKIQRKDAEAKSRGDERNDGSPAVPEVLDDLDSKMSEANLLHS